MSYLLYCIVGAEHEEPRDGVRLLGYPRASIMVRSADLGAVLSEASQADLAPDVPRLLAYAAVIDSFNRHRTVIPMRFGCRFTNLTEAAGLLECERQRYGALLRELSGRVEMSVHVTARPCEAPKISEEKAPAPGRGIAYLEERRRYYSMMQQAEQRREEIAARICAMARGCFVSHTGPAASRDKASAFSIHFLVPRDRVGAFSDSLRAIAGPSEPAVGVSGPWPPYNFVASAT